MSINLFKTKIFFIDYYLFLSILTFVYASDNYKINLTIKYKFFYIFKMFYINIKNM